MLPDKYFVQLTG